MLLVKGALRGDLRGTAKLTGKVRQMYSPNGCLGQTNMPLLNLLEMEYDDLWEMHSSISEYALHCGTVAVQHSRTCLEPGSSNRYTLPQREDIKMSPRKTGHCLLQL